MKEQGLRNNYQDSIAELKPKSKLFQNLNIRKPKVAKKFLEGYHFWVYLPIPKNKLNKNKLINKNYFDVLKKYFAIQYSLSVYFFRNISIVTLNLPSLKV